MKKCTCGAKFTSNPTYHSEWCDVNASLVPSVYDKLQELMEDKLRMGLYLPSRMVCISTEAFDKLKQEVIDRNNITRVEDVYEATILHYRSSKGLIYGVVDLMDERCLDLREEL